MGPLYPRMIEIFGGSFESITAIMLISLTTSKRALRCYKLLAKNSARVSSAS
jgi:hypothetical protein